MQSAATGGSSLRLQARQLACERDDRLLFCDLDLEVGPGQIVRIEGPNGSGKTTLLKILSGQLGDYQGELYWDDAPMHAARDAFLANLLYLGHAPGIKGALTALENLSWHQALAGEVGDHRGRMAALAEIGLVGFEDVPCAQLSAGQQRRVALARLILIPRLLWVLDEPFTAIDKDGVAALERRLLSHAARGGSVILTTHHDLAPLGDIRRVRLGEGGSADAAR
ncbi:cytochrome c biogenesis heme-transporting ATPase CcmA [Franzmannia qiaohouensis]|uniref:Cytochrome c biogenesis heme-transporting ATPase CcmA n=1 Tax=Franzmannia qiaohouensis TaxID=1329370 RepID=A0ABU1HG12_9GAMM|nr:cytochrome c biogenesis heme-transporting ATPase CcmA [Halomonas qiaohouensis]MDR5906408.1 cytochrome c biogenesis heme-transporting ATPase CcmA [Halomonas qiaohouensis]